MSTGIDSEGHAANFVETEQIVLYEGAKASFVQASRRASHAIKRFELCLFCTWLFMHLSVQPSHTKVIFKFVFSSPDTRLHTLLLESEAQPQIQT